MEAESSLEERPTLVLIVEDETSIASAIGYMVEDAGYQPMFAANGREALNLLAQYQVGLIITDLMMPVMNGDELIIALRAQWDETLIPPLVMMTAAGADYAQRSGADQIIEKPFDIEEIEEILHYFLS